MRWVATLLVVGCHFGNAVPVTADAAADASGDSASDVPGVCPNGYTLKGAHCYALVTQQLSWTNARAMCQSSGADLAWPPDQDTLQLMTDFVASAHDYWIGIYDPTMNGAFVTVSNQVPVFLPWAAGEPKPSNDCVLVHQSGGVPEYVAQNCNNNSPAICDRPPM